ncbi:MAG: cupredoxin domain-containing protein [Stellaceae bacterium]
MRLRTRRGCNRLVSLLLVAALLCATAAAAARINWARTRLVTVVAVDYRFVPDHLVFRRGVPYRLHVANRGKALHELHAPAFFRTVVLRNPAALNPEHSELVLQPGEQKDLYFVARRRGQYDMRCPDHDWAGMTGDITVK